jgi:aminoglycoside 6'-N-acetyltransferase I
MQVEVRESTSETAHVIRNLYPLYLHDLSAFNGVAPNAHGSCEPASTVRTLAQQGDLAYQTVWWEKPGVLFPLLVLVAGMPAGFALIASPPYIPPNVDFSVAEFFIVRPHRGRGIGERAAIAVFEKFQGRWDLAILPKNHAARRFWRDVIGRYMHGEFSSGRRLEGDGEMDTFQFANAGMTYLPKP